MSLCLWNFFDGGSKQLRFLDRKLPSIINMSHLEARFRFYRLFMKGKFDV